MATIMEILTSSTVVGRVHPTLEDLQNEATWLERRSLIVPPLHATEMVTTEQSRAEFLEGARLLRLDQLRNYAGEVIGPSPIQLVIADILTAGHKLNGLLEPRRTGKTSGIQATLIGRCALREDYLVGWTLATTGAKAGERFKKDIVGAMVRLYPDPHTRPFKIGLAKGSEGIHWQSTGSYFDVYSPGGDGFRSGAFDVAWVDEAGEAEVELGDDITAAVRPTLHTRAGAQFILSGTAPAYRGGNLLWDALSDERAGVLRHGVPDDVDPEALSGWEPTEENPKGNVRELVLAAHPGVGYTTPLDAIEDDFNTPAMRKSFSAEILSLPGMEGSNVALISAPRWTEAALPLEDAGNRAPERFAMVAVVSPNADFSAVGAAWLGRDKKVHVGLLHHQVGVQGFAKKLLNISRKHKRAVWYDSGSNATTVEIMSLRESRPRMPEKPLVTRDIGRAAVVFMNLLKDDRLRHHDQLELNSAVEIAVKRPIGANAWGFGGPKKRDDYDITGLEAVSLAVYALDQEKGKSGPPVIEFF